MTQEKQAHNFHFHESTWREQTDAPNAMARAQVLKSFTLKFQQSNKCLWGNKRGRTKEENHKRTPRSRSTKFPSLRGEMDWWKCRSRSSLTFRSKICKNHGRD